MALEDMLDAHLHPLPPPPSRVGRGRIDVDAEAIADTERRRLGLGDGSLVGQRKARERDTGLRIFSMELPGPVAG